MTNQRRVLVTGCASGIGKHLSERLVARGHRVMLTDIDEPSLERWTEREWGGGRDGVLLRHLDVRRSEDWKAALEAMEEEFGGVDMALNIAGYLNPANVVDMSDEDVERHLDINAKGVVLGTRAAAQAMVRQGGGHIVNMGSLASLSPVPGLSAYAASKFAVRGFSLSVAEELRPRGVAVTLMCLDAVKTPMLDLQAGHEEAALTFSGPGALTLAQVESLFFEEVWHGRPLEVSLPRHRGVLARLAGTLPGLNRWMVPWLKRWGRRAQRRYQGES